MLFLYAQMIELLKLVNHVHDLEFELALSPKTKFLRQGSHILFYLHH